MIEGLDWDILLSARERWAYFACCPERSVDQFVRSAPLSARPVVRIIRGKRCGDTQALFQEWSAALQFPYYFGGNWDAFEECVGDLEWLSAAKCVFFLTHTGLVLRKAQKDFGILVDILKRAANEWLSGEETVHLHGNADAVFRIVFHCEPGDEIGTRKRLADAGVDLGSDH